jgi:hypothetical protein
MQGWLWCAHTLLRQTRPQPAATLPLKSRKNLTRLTINALPAIAVLNRGKAGETDDHTVTMREFPHGDRWTIPETGELPRLEVTTPLRRVSKYEILMPQIAAVADAGSSIDLISRELGFSAEVVRDALHLHRTGKRPPGRIDGRRRRNRNTGQPTVPKYQQIAAEVEPPPQGRRGPRPASPGDEGQPGHDRQRLRLRQA